MKILVINGPNLNMLGKRDPSIYGSVSLDSINKQLAKIAQSKKINLVYFQSNHEGAIIDFLQKESSRNADGILINPGALTHYGYSLTDSLADARIPIVEIHLSDINNREDFRKIDVLNGIVIKKISGKRERSYYIGLDYLIKFLKK